MAKTRGERRLFLSASVWSRLTPRAIPSSCLKRKALLNPNKTEVQLVDLFREGTNKDKFYVGTTDKLRYLTLGKNEK